ncbi:unnamed protein product [Vicia faba]|uniref:Rx N-terminal domain-containing protein n=1 Tax=Vicia faba TaxID=3906 RepID=A0AAV0ZGQ6_VICFA|nr:unnamed protein product [Vicia faba]
MKEMIVGAFLSTLFGVVLERLASSNLIDYFRRVKLDTLVDNLESTLNSINQVLDDAEKKQYENPDVKTWLGDVKHAMYEADQLLDEIATDAPLKKMRIESQPSTSSIFNFIPTFINPFKSRLTELIENLDYLAEQKDKLQLKKRVCVYNEDGVNSELSERLPTTYLVDASQIYGRDADKDEMIKFLLSKNANDNQVPVVSIVGLGGMVGEQNGSDLKELEKLNHLHGTIYIKGLGKVIDPADAATANLKDKKYLQEIQMIFDGGREEMDGSLVERNVFVLKALQPNSNLKRLTIENYNGNMFPNWLRDFHLSNLISLKLQNCGLCSHLPPLGQLPFLKELSISGCKGIKIIGQEFYGNNSTNVPFKSLEVLELKSMINWEEWFCLEGFPLLKNLNIRYCPKLKRALPQHLPSLLSLEIYDCEELEASTPEGGLPSNLRDLKIVNCPKLIASREELGLFQLNSLEWFKVGDKFENVESFPEENLLPPTLKFLYLYDCSKLGIINYKGLPNSLQSLSSKRCPLLKEQFQKEEGESWHRISHIRYVEFG